jgi:hypothetical protein
MTNDDTVRFLGTATLHFHAGHPWNRDPEKHAYWNCPVWLDLAERSPGRVRVKNHFICDARGYNAADAAAKAATLAAALEQLFQDYRSGVFATFAKVFQIEEYIETAIKAARGAAALAAIEKLTAAAE